jgi:hypothetical protein
VRGHSCCKIKKNPVVVPPVDLKLLNLGLALAKDLPQPRPQCAVRVGDDPWRWICPGTWPEHTWSAVRKSTHS